MLDLVYYLSVCEIIRETERERETGDPPCHIFVCFLELLRPFRARWCAHVYMNWNT